MTTKELIDLLAVLPPDSPVVFMGYSNHHDPARSYFHFRVDESTTPPALVLFDYEAQPPALTLFEYTEPMLGRVVKYANCEICDEIFPVVAGAARCYHCEGGIFEND